MRNQFKILSTKFGSQYLGEQSTNFTDSTLNRITEYIHFTHRHRPSQNLCAYKEKLYLNRSLLMIFNVNASNLGHVRCSLMLLNRSLSIRYSTYVSRINTLLYSHFHKIYAKTENFIVIVLKSQQNLSGNLKF